MIETGPGWELRLGDWQDVLTDVECDSVITDPPYSDRTHDGHDNSSGTRKDGTKDTCERRDISYTSWGYVEIHSFVWHWSQRCGWLCAMSDSVLCEKWREITEEIGRTGFHPLPCVIPGMTVRLCGDGPSSWAVYLNVSRPKSLSKWGTLPGAYICKPGERVHIGGKPLDLMRAIVRDYTKPGDLVCDPCAGAGTTLLAAVIEGRRAIGSEIDPEAFDVAVKRLRKGYTPNMFSEE